MQRIQGWVEQGGVVDAIQGPQGPPGPQGPIGPPGSTINAILGPAYVSAADFPGTDMASKVLAAHNALPAAGGVIDARSLPGNQTWGSTVIFTKPVNLLLGSSTITATVNSTNGAIQLTAEGSSIEGLGPTITLFQSNQVGGVGINLFANKTSLRNMTVRGACTAHCTVAGTSIGINSGNTSDVELDNVVVERWNDIGVNTGGGATNWRLSNMVIQDNYADGMFFGGGTGHMLLQSVMRNNGANGVDINSDHTRVLGSFIYSNGYNLLGGDCVGVLIDSIGQSVDGCELIGNHIYSNSCSGVLIRAEQSRSSSAHLLVGNEIYSNTSFGINIDTSVGGTCGTSNDILIDSNQVSSNGNNGIFIGGGSGTPCVVNRTRISNNQVIANTGTGIYVFWGSDAQVTNNTSLNNTVAQLNVNGGSDIRTLDFNNKTDATVNLCTLGNGTLGVNTIQPATGVVTTLKSTGNTEFQLTSSGAGYNSYGIFLDNSHDLNVYDHTNGATRVTLDNNGFVTFAVGVITNLMKPIGGGSVVQLSSGGNTGLEFTSGAVGTGQFEILIDNSGNFYPAYDLAHGPRITVNPAGVVTFANTLTVQGAGGIGFGGTLFASLGAPGNGTITFCGDCTIANPCAGGGSGAFAKRLAGVWVCN